MVNQWMYAKKKKIIKIKNKSGNDWKFSFGD